MKTTEERDSLNAHDAAIRDSIPASDRSMFDIKLERLAAGDSRIWNSIPFPLEVALELAAVCNLDCIMCPVPATSRPRTLMDPGLSRQVIDQLAGEPGFVLLPQGFGETMLHAKWAELVGYAVEKGIRPIFMLTNGTLLNERNIVRLLDLAIDVLVVSIDGVKPETYAAVRVGGNLEKVEANVRRFLELRGSRQHPRLVLRIIRMKETRHELDAFFERWNPLLREGDEINVNEYNDWSGRVDDHSVNGFPAPRPERGPCRMLWRNLSVHADGKVSACCHDSEDELIIGDLAMGETLREIWKGEKLARLRCIHQELRFEELPICQNCKNWW